MPQRLHLVFGGELVDPQRTEFRDVDDDRHRRHLPDYASAYAAWKAQGAGDGRQRPHALLHRPPAPAARRGAGGGADREARLSARRARRCRDGPAPVPAAAASISPLSRRAAASRGACCERRQAEGKEDARAARRAHGRGRAAAARGPARLVPRRERRRGGVAARDAAPAAAGAARASPASSPPVTVTSAQFLADRLPESCIHQFAPVDVLPWVRRFLDHWRPDLAVWTESELWPAMLSETHAPRHPDAADQRPHLERGASGAGGRCGGMARALLGALRPHPRPGRPRRRAADARSAPTRRG